MDRDALRTLQEPLKQRYRDDPEAAVVTLKAAGKLGEGVTCSIETDRDFRGTLAVAKDAPVGFRAIRLTFTLDTSATPELLDTLLRLTERYWVVLQTIKQAPAVTTRWETA